MKTNYRQSYLICCTVLLSLFSVISWQVQAETHEIQTFTHPSGKTCLTGWLPLQYNQSSSCLQVVSCFDENDTPITKKETKPTVTTDICPDNLQQAMLSDPDVTALVNIHQGNNTLSEYISVSTPQDSSSWFYGWSAANFGVSLLHMLKASQKIRLFSNGDVSNKNIYFFASYMIGAFHHVLEMPFVMASHFITTIPHLIIHSGTLILSIIERLLDCNCCGQFKNGHNTMIVFHVIALAFAFSGLW